MCNFSDYLRYDHVSGKLYWLPREDNKTWNAQRAGKEAFTASYNGYKVGAVNSKKYLAHRVIWKMLNGVDAEQIDHINGDRSDNRPQNLRSVAHVDNARNCKEKSTNKSGYTGVSWSSSTNKWMATIGVGGKTKYLGVFCDIREAAEARQKAEAELGYHENHGRKK